MYAIIVNNCRVGTVASFAGNKPAERWVGFAHEAKQGFRTRREAAAWVVEQHELEKEKS
jgi:hypothetical protein